MNRELGRPIGVSGATLLLGAAVACLVVLAVVTFLVAARLQQRPLTPLADKPSARQLLMTGPSGQAAAAPSVTAVPIAAKPSRTATPSPTSTRRQSALTSKRAPSKSPTGSPSARQQTSASRTIKHTVKPAAVQPRPADLSPTHLQLINKESGRCLDSGPPGSGNPDGLPYTLPCNGGNFQQWSGIPVRSGSRVMLLKDAQTGLCLTVSPNTQGATKKCNAGDTTLQWTWRGTNADSVYVQVSSGSCLTGDAGQDVMPGGCGGSYQHWRQTS